MAPDRGDAHDLLRHPVEGCDELLEDLNVWQNQARIVLKLQRSRKRLLASQVMQPVLRTTAEQSSRLRRTHIFQQPRIMQMYSVCRIEVRTAVLFIIRRHVILTARILSNTRGEAPDAEQSWWTSKGPSRDKSGVLGWATATIGSPVGEPTTDPETSSSIIRWGVRGDVSIGESVDSPTSNEALHDKYWSIGARPDAGPATSSDRNNGEILDGIGSDTEPGGDTWHNRVSSRSGPPPPTGRMGEATTTGAESTTDSTGIGGTGYNAGVKDVPTS